MIGIAIANAVGMTRGGGGGGLPAPLTQLTFADATLDPAESFANRLSTTALSTSLLPGPQVLDAPTWPTVSGSPTRTGMQDDESGGKLATRLVMADGAAIRYGEPLNGIQQTFRFRAKSNTGSAHNITVGSWLTSAQRATVSVGTDWTTVSVTMASGNHTPWIGAVGNAVDITIDARSLSSVAGAVALSPPAVAGHIYNGLVLNLTGGRPAKQGARAITAANANRSRVSLPQPLNTADFCIAMSVKMTAVSGSNTSMISSVFPSNTTLQIRTSSSKFALTVNNTVALDIQPFTMVSRGWALVSVQRKSATNEVEVYINGDLVQTSPFTPTAQNVHSFDVGRFQTTSGAFPGSVGDLYVYDRSLTPAEQRALADEWATDFAAQAEAIFEQPHCHLFIGDSITAGNPTYTYVDSMASALLTAEILPARVAVSGETLQDLQGRLDQYRSLVKSGRTTTASVMVGYNDFNSGLYATAAAMWADYLPFIEGLETMGFDEVFVITNTPTGVSAVDNKLSDLATLIRNGEATGPYTVIDLRADAAAGDGTPATGYADNVHPNAARHDLIAGFIQPIIIAAVPA